MTIDKKFIDQFIKVSSKAALASSYLVGKKNKIAAKYALDNPDIYETWQQKSILRQYGLSDQEIKNLKNSTNRVEKIHKLQEKNKNQILPRNDDKKDFYKPRSSTKKVEETGVKLRSNSTGVKTRSSGEVKVRNRIKTP